MTVTVTPACGGDRPDMTVMVDWALKNQLSALGRCIFTAFLPDESQLLQSHSTTQPARLIRPSVRRISAECFQEKGVCCSRCCEICNVRSLVSSHGSTFNFISPEGIDTELIILILRTGRWGGDGGGREGGRGGSRDGNCLNMDRERET